jgi:hypothetical protein
MSDLDLHDRLTTILRASPTLMGVLEVAQALDLPDWRVFSGAIYQTVWNHLTGRDPDHGIKDYDLGYFDSADLSYEAEDKVIKAAAAAYAPPVRDRVEVRNQARVHLWFPDHFKEPYDPLTGTDEALTRFVAPAYAVGVRLEANGLITVAAPFGLEDIFAMIIRPNPVRGLTPGFQRTVDSARARWPELKVAGT